MNLEKEKAIGLKAAELLRSEVLSKAFDEIREQVNSDLRASKNDVVKVQQFLLQLDALDKVQEKLRAFVDNGLVAESELSWLDKLKAMKSKLRKLY